MPASAERPAFYALGRGLPGDLLALAHPPYTAWHLSYVAIGASIAPHLYVNRLLWALAAFALAVGVAAHALDELHDRPLRTGLSDRTLIALSVLSLLGALAIGVAGIVEVTAWLAPFVVAGALFLPAYNLELAYQFNVDRGLPLDEIEDLLLSQRPIDRQDASLNPDCGRSTVTSLKSATSAMSTASSGRGDERTSFCKP